MYCTIDNARPDGAIFFYYRWLLLFYRGKKVVRYVQFYWTRDYFSNMNDVFNKTPSSMLKTVDLEYHSSLLVAWMVRSKVYISFLLFCQPIKESLDVLRWKQRKGWQLPGRTQCPATELWQPDNHQPSQSSMCTAQVILKYLSHTPGSHSISNVSSESREGWLGWL